MITSDPYITINDNTGHFGALPIDSVKTNSSDPFALSCSPSAPEGHQAQFGLILADGGFCDTINFNLTIGRFDYLVLNLDPTPQSGAAIDSILGSLGYSGVHTTGMPSDLSCFKTMFVCLGIWPNNTVLSASGAYAAQIVSFINDGGRVYMEGGDMWYYDPMSGGGYNFGPLFGIQAIADGSGNLGPVLGITGTFTSTMNFNYSGENNYIDQINASGSGFVILRDGNDNYNCGVANSATAYKTVGTSFELGMLTDAVDASTRADLLDSIMTFFGINSSSVEEQPVLTSPYINLSVSPNPFFKEISVRFTAPSNLHARVEIFDLTGRLVKDFHFGRHDGERLINVNWEGRDFSGCFVPKGVYFVNVVTGENSAQEKIIFVE